MCIRLTLVVAGYWDCLTGLS